MNKFYIIFLPVFLSVLSLHAQTNLIDFGSAWKYLDNGSNQGTVWRSIAFNDGTWKIGNGKFGYGISDAITNISYGTNATKKYITTYFRKSFTINNAALYSSYTGNVKRDDGVAVYVNGLEVYRNNLPSGTLSYTTKATTASDNGTISKAFQINASAFVSGTNVIAVEIHQDKTNTPDMAFDLSLVGNPDLTAPSVNSINRQSPTATTTNATSVIYRVTFSEKVNGVDVSDFTSTVVSGAVSGTVASVTAVGTIGDTYDVTVNSITGDGTFRLDLNGTGTGITDAAGNSISSGYSSGQTYIIDHTAPLVNSINRQSPITQNTSATSVIYRVTFSEKVNGVDVSDFTATVVSGPVSGTVASVTPVGTIGDTYDVTVSSITGDGTLRLDLNGTGTGITDAAGNSISGGYSSGDTYIIQAADLTAPVVNSINRQSPSTQTTSATSIIYRVTFSEMVTGVDASDFTSTVVSGTLSNTIASVAAVGTTGDIYDVTVSSITGDGTLRLDLNAAGTGIADAAGNAINGGYNNGQTYIIDHTAPVVNSINRQSPITDTTSLTSVTYRVTFSEMVTGVDTSDFAATAVSGTVSGAVVSVTAVGTTSDIYDVTVSSIIGSGTLRLDLKASGTGITDGAANAISGGYSSGQTYIIQSAILTNSSLKFNGTNSYVNLYNDSSLHLTSFTLEAWVKPLGTGVTTTSGNGGVIAFPIITKGRGESETPANLNLNYFLGIDANKKLVADFEEGSGPNHPVISNTSIKDSVWTHVAVSYEPVSAVWKIYINGVLDVTKDLGSNIIPSNTSIQQAAIATSFNSTGISDGYFKGNIDEVRIWNVARADAEILNNYNLELTNATGLVARYGLNEGTGTTAVNSISSSNNGTLINNPLWSTGFNQTTVNTPPNMPANPSPEVGTYSSTSTTLCATVSDPENNQLRVRYYGRKKATNNKFTIVMLPDTQFYTAQENGGNNEMFKAQTNWIANNRASRNIVYVGQLGDCTDHGDTYEIEWKRADTAMKTIENATLTGLIQGVPYGVCVGNHDQTPEGNNNGTTKFYNQYFGSSRFTGRSYYGGHQGSNNDNNYQLFSASGIDFLVISLEYDTTNSFALGTALSWADSLVKGYPNREVIVMSHWVLKLDSTFSNLGKAVYNRLKVYPNFILMIGGHVNTGDGEAKRSDTYNGNKVTTILSNYQNRINGGNGLMRIYEFDPPNNNVAAQTYSPYTNTYETDANSQFNLSVNLTSNAPYTLIGEVSNVTSSNNACVNWPSLEQNADYEWYVEVFDGQFTTTGPTWSFTTKAPIASNIGTHNNIPERTR